MAQLDTLVKVNISLAAATVPQASFSIPLIIGPTQTSWAQTDFVHSYGSPEDMLSDGFSTGSPEYIYALEMFEQTVTPAIFYVGIRQPAVKQVDTFQVNTVTVAHAYSFQLNQVLISYTAQGGDTQQSILAALLAAISTAFSGNPPVTGAVTGSGSGATLTLTAVNFGASQSYTAIDSLLTFANMTANYGIQNDLNNIILKNNLWYGIILCSNQDYDILQLSALVESLLKIFIGVTADSNVPTSSTSDIASVMMGKAYKRSALMYTPSSFADGIESAWMGGQLPLTPGSNNWAWQTLAGIVPDNLTDNQVAILIGNLVAQTAGKNVNIYTTFGGVDATMMGQMTGGQFIDITILIDWLQSQIQTNIVQSLKDAAAANSKIPYTDTGTAVFIQDVRSAIDLGIFNGGIDGNAPITISAPPVASVPQNQRLNRLAPTISFSCRLQGAFNGAIVNGTLTI